MVTGLKIKQVFFVLAVLLATQVLGQTKEQMLVKKWRLEDIKQGTPVTPELQVTVDNWVSEMKSKYRLEYHADGTYYTQMGDKEITGTWKLSADGSEMLCNTDAGESKVFKVQQLMANKFVFTVQEGKEMVTFYMVPAPNNNLLYIIGGIAGVGLMLGGFTLLKNRNATKKNKK